MVRMSLAAPPIQAAMLFSDRENANAADGERLMVDLELDDGLAVITIDRPHARNAISLETMDQLGQATARSYRAATSRNSARCARSWKRRAWLSGCAPSAIGSPASPRRPSRC